MSAGVAIKHKRKASAFVGGELLAGEVGVNTAAKRLEFSSDGIDVNPVTGGGANIAEVELDFGAQAVSEKVFTVTDATVSATSKVVAKQSGKAATGRQADENEFDVISLVSSPGAGQFTVYARCLTGLVQGKYKMVYQVG